MLPFEAHLLAAGWPRWEDAPASSSGQEEEEEQDGDSGSSGERVLAREGSRAARMLFMARRCAGGKGGVRSGGALAGAGPVVPAWYHAWSVMWATCGTPRCIAL